MQSERLRRNGRMVSSAHVMIRIEQFAGSLKRTREHRDGFSSRIEGETYLISWKGEKKTFIFRIELRERDENLPIWTSLENIFRVKIAINCCVFAGMVSTI